MILKKCFLTANDCYKAAKKMTNGKPTGIVVHSTGANNPDLKRYVQPLVTDKEYETIIEDLGVNSYKNHWNQDKQAMGRSVCVHAFIGKNAKGVVETYQTLPFDICCWGVGSGKKGSYNSNPQARIQFEICEDGLNDKDYFDRAMKEAQEFCAHLCKLYGFGVDKISSHKESHLQGYGNNHEDPHNWLTKFGKGMDWFRDEVNKLLGKNTVTESVDSDIPVNTSNNKSSERLVYEYLHENTNLNNAAICGILANLNAESGFESINLQNAYEKRLNYSDREYTFAVDNGDYDNFVGDKAGYGLAQWTHWSRKQKLLDYAKARNTSIGDYKMQLDFLLEELKGYKALWNYLTTCVNEENSTYECGFRFCYDFERPANRESNSKSRGERAKSYFQKYNKPNTVTETISDINSSLGNLTYGAIHINSTYDFLGGLQYRSSREETGSEAKPSRVKVTNKAPESWAHPVHVRSINSSGEFIKGVYGWVDIKTLKSEEKVVEPYNVKVTADALNFRKGPGSDHAIVGTIRDKGVYTIVDTVGNWGLLKSYALTRCGWINLSYTKRL